MLRRDRFADRIIRDDREGIDRQSLLPRNKIPDIPLKDVSQIRVYYPPRPLTPTGIEPFPPLKTTTGIVGDFREVVIPSVTDGVGEVGGVNLKERGKKISMYIIIGAVIIIGIIAIRR